MSTRTASTGEKTLWPTDRRCARPSSTPTYRHAASRNFSELYLELLHGAGGARTHDRRIMRTTARRSGALPARIRRRLAADGAYCTVCTDGSVHEPVHDYHSERLTPTTERYHAPREASLWSTCALIGHGDAVPDPGDLLAAVGSLSLNPPPEFGSGTARQTRKCPLNWDNGSI